MTTLTTARVVPAPPGEHAGDQCSACRCYWHGSSTPQPEECSAWTCICHDDAAADCDNCQTITTDYTLLDPGRGRALWYVCGSCRDKWTANEAVAS